MVRATVMRTSVAATSRVDTVMSIGRRGASDEMFGFCEERWTKRPIHPKLMENE